MTDEAQTPVEPENSGESDIESEYVIVEAPPASEEKNGDSLFFKTAMNKIESWKNANLNLAVIGCSSNEKSALIDHLSGRTSTKPDYGVKSLANDSYPVPNASETNKNFTVWDLGPAPSCPTSSQMSEFVSKHITSTLIDFFIICAEGSSLCSAELFIAQKLTEAGKNFCVVHFYSHESDSNEHKEHAPVDTIKEEIIERITQNLKLELGKIQSIDANVFPLSSNLQDSANLSRLYSNLIEKLDAKKLHTFLYSIGPWFKEVIIQKTSSLRSRIYYISILNCVCGIFVPELAITVDLLILSHELWFYLDQLGISSRQLKTLVETKNMVFPKIQEIIERSKFEPFFSAENIHAISDLIAKYLPLFLVSNKAVSLAQHLPVIGSLVGGAATFLTTKYALESFLDEFYRVAMSLNDLTALIDQEREKLRTEHCKPTLERTHETNEESR